MIQKKISPENLANIVNQTYEKFWGPCLEGKQERASVQYVRPSPLYDITKAWPQSRFVFSKSGLWGQESTLHQAIRPCLCTTVCWRVSCAGNKTNMCLWDSYRESTGCCLSLGKTQRLELPWRSVGLKQVWRSLCFRVLLGPSWGQSDSWGGTAWGPEWIGRGEQLSTNEILSSEGNFR